MLSGGVCLKCLDRDPICPLTCLVLHRLNNKPHFLRDRSADEAADAVGSANWWLRELGNRDKTLSRILLACRRGKTMATLKQLEHEYDTTRGLWCMDRNPAEVDYDWIKRNAFQLTDNLKGPEEERGNGIAIGAFTLKQGKNPGMVWMMGPSGQTSELDEKVLEDLFKSFF